MTLRDAARRFAKQRQPIVVPGSLPAIGRTVEREMDVAQRFGVSAQLRAPPDLTEIQRRLIKQLEGDGSEPIDRRDLRYAPLCIWDGKLPIAERPRLLERLIRTLETTGRRAIVRMLAAVFFRHFRAHLAGIELVGAALSRLVDENIGSNYRLQSDFSVFDSREGPARVARYCILSNTAPQRLLRGYGLAGEALTSGFGVAVYRCGMAYIAGELTRKVSRSLVERALEWTEEPAPAEYRFGAATFANTLLLPFAGGSEPPDDLKNYIVDLLLDRIGDPRTRSDRWQNMAEAAEIARRWLTGVALRQYLDVVDQVAHLKHWNYRRAFWTAYYEKGAISQAWVAFGPLGAMRARRDFGENLKFGTIATAGKPVEPGHAVLVMRLGDYVAVDWSQNGRCIIWPEDHPDAPRLYEETYRSGDIAPTIAPRGGGEWRHIHSHKYKWQRRVAEFIRRNIGFGLHESDYRVI